MFEAGRVVISVAGHDGNWLYVVVEGEKDGYCLVANGKRKKLASPKRKNILHLRATNILLNSYPTDRSLRKQLGELQNS